jgi:Immunity protein Imm1
MYGVPGTPALRARKGEAVMVIRDFKGEFEVEKQSALEEILRRRDANGINQYYLRPAVNQYPILDLAFIRDACVLMYYPHAGGGMFISEGRSDDYEPYRLEFGATATFYILGNPWEPFWIGADAIVPFAIALAAAKEFFSSTDLPQCLEWLEL